jgi:NADH dehydrogenase FAD-containing subunit
VLLVEAGPTILAGSSPQLIDKATSMLSDLGVEIYAAGDLASVADPRTGRRHRRHHPQRAAGPRAQRSHRVEYRQSVRHLRGWDPVAR